MQKGLAFLSFGIKFSQGFLPQDHLPRRTYVNKMLQLTDYNLNFYEIITKNDLDGFVNKQTNRFRVLVTPSINYGSCLYRLKVSIWCAI